MDNLIKSSSLRGTLEHDFSLASLTSWHVGGRAERLFRPADLEDLQAYLSEASNSEPLTWLGLGSNVLIRDGGIAGTVILTLKGLSQLSALNEQTLRAEVGVPCAKLAKYCVNQNLVGGAFFAGIPGTVGGALAMNAGAFGSETWEYVVAVETIDRDGKVHIRQPHDFKISYREVHPLFPDEWFVAGHFAFTSGDGEFTERAIKMLLKKRSETQPIGQFSCGSVFRNPPNDYSARLIEATGLKGLQIGDARVADKHANFIINGGQATAADIEALIEQVQAKVWERQGIKLVREVIILGEAN